MKIKFYSLLNLCCICEQHHKQSNFCFDLDTTKHSCCSKPPVFSCLLSSDSSRTELRNCRRKHKHPLDSIWWQWTCLYFSQCFLCFFLLVVVTGDNIGRVKKVFPVSLSKSPALSPFWIWSVLHLRSLLFLGCVAMQQIKKSWENHLHERTACLCSYQ